MFQQNAARSDITKGKKTRGNMTEPKQQYPYCPVRATTIMPDDVGSLLTDVEWFSNETGGKSSAMHQRENSVQN
jgi:hypothetical protein